MQRLAIIVAMLASPAATRGDEPSSGVAAPVSESSAGRNLNAAPEVTPAEAERREHAKTAAVLLLLGIAAAGGLLIALIVLWGFRVRRNIRRPLKKTRPPDDLWYLRKNAPRDSIERPEGRP